MEGAMVPVFDGHIPVLTVTFPKAFIDIPSVSNSLLYNNKSGVSGYPSSLSITSINTSSFSTGASAPRGIRMLYSPTNIPIKLNWTATGKA